MKGATAGLVPSGHKLMAQRSKPSLKIPGSTDIPGHTGTRDAPDHAPIAPHRPPLGAALLLAPQLAPSSAAAAEGQAPVDPPTVQLQRIEVTGSAIRRVDAETAVPISVLRAEELRQQGVTSTEELIGRLSGNQGVYNSSRSVGSATGGASFADLRGSARTRPWCCSTAGVWRTMPSTAPPWISTPFPSPPSTGSRCCATAPPHCTAPMPSAG